MAPRSTFKIQRLSSNKCFWFHVKPRFRCGAFLLLGHCGNVEPILREAPVLGFAQVASEGFGVGWRSATLLVHDRVLDRADCHRPRERVRLNSPWDHSAILGRSAGLPDRSAARK